MALEDEAERETLLDAALAEGADIVGGLDPATIDGDRAAHLDAVFALAAKHGKGIDIHLHERGATGLATIHDICARTTAAGLHGQATISHAFALGDAAEGEFAAAAGALATQKRGAAGSYATENEIRRLGDA